MQPRGMNAIALEKAAKISNSEIDIPEEFIDQILTYEIMDIPVLLDGKHYVDQNALWEWWEKEVDNPKTKTKEKSNYWLNPYTSVPFLTYEVDSALKERIEIYTQTHVQKAHDEAAKKLVEKWHYAEQQLKQHLEDTDNKLAQQMHLDMLKEKRDSRIKQNYENRITIYKLLLQDGHTPKEASELARKYEQPPSLLETISLLPEIKGQSLISPITFFGGNFYSAKMLAAQKPLETDSELKRNTSPSLRFSPLDDLN